MTADARAADAPEKPPETPAEPPAEREVATGRGGTFGWRVAVLELAPAIAAVLAFLAGIALLASAAQPAMPERLALIVEAWPLVVVELSHFVASVVGVLLLLVAGGLWRRLDGAYWLALILLVSGAAFSLLKALDLEEAVALTLVALLLAPCRPAFFRRSRLTAGLFTGAWTAAVAVGLLLTVWLFLMSYAHVAYRDELWWTILRDADIARSLRATAGALIVGLFGLAWIALHPDRPRRSAEAVAADLARAEAISAKAEGAHGEANLAFTGDKSFVYTPSGNSFVMYRARGGRWIAMGDPVGPRAERCAALSAFHAAADAASAAPVIYAASLDLLPALIDLGYTIRKIGEAAVVDLAGFSLDGQARAKLRNTRNRLTKDGWRVTVAAPGEITDWDGLRAVSDAWLAKHVGREKAFSLGRFEPDYLRRFPLAIVAREAGPPVAFASLWPTPDRGDLAVDLMRYGPEAPPNVMDFLFLGVIAWAQGQGFRHLDIGMAPLAGLSTGRYAPPLSKLGSALFAWGEDLYGFKGLRAYKSKFGPTWRPIFIAAPAQVSLPMALADAAILTAGGLLGLLRR